MELIQNDRVIFNELTHTYFLDKKKKLIGVTSLMKKHGLSPDYSDIDPHVLNHAAARGTAVHKTLEAYDNHLMFVTPITVSDNEGGTATFDTTQELEAYKRAMLNYDGGVIASEYLVSDNDVVASSIDKVAETNEEGVYDLLDIKTTSTLHVDALTWQLSIYAYLFELQNPGAKVRRLIGVRVRDDSCTLTDVERMPAEEVKKLIASEKNGLPYCPPKKEQPELDGLITKDQMDALIADENRLAEAEAKVKAIKARIDEIHAKIAQYMGDNKLDKLPFDGGWYTYVKPSVTTSLDSARLKKDMPDVYNKYYTKRSERKGYVKVNLKSE